MFRRTVVWMLTGLIALSAILSLPALADDDDDRWDNRWQREHDRWHDHHDRWRDRDNDRDEFRRWSTSYYYGYPNYRFRDAHRTLLRQMLMQGYNPRPYPGYPGYFTQSVRYLPYDNYAYVSQGRGLPPGIAKKMIMLPPGHNTRLGFPPHLQVGIMGDDAILYDPASMIVHDILRNVF